MVWSRETAAVCDVRAPAPLNGRMPAKTLRTSSRDGFFSRYSAAVCRMNSISCSKATGSSGASSIGRVGGADERVAVPRDREHHAAVAGVRHHDGALAGEKRRVEDEMHALAGRDGGLGRGVGHAAHGVAERAGGVDHDSAPRLRTLRLFRRRETVPRPSRRQ